MNDGKKANRRGSTRMDLALEAQARHGGKYEPGLVSVIIITFNRAELVLQAIESVQRQTWKTTQIIVVDDGSTDDTKKLIENMPGIFYIRQENQGMAAARNKGLTHASGEFVAALDSDDLWSCDFLEQSVTALRTLQVELVFSNWTAIYADGTVERSYFEMKYEWWKFSRSKIPHWRIVEPSLIRKIMLDSCIAPTSAWLIRRESMGDGWTKFIDLTEDWSLVLDVVLSKPCSVGANMKRSWLKRKETNNIFDGAKIPVSKSMQVYSPRRILLRHRPQLTRKEKAHLRWKFAANLWLLRGKEKSIAKSTDDASSITPIARDLLEALIAGFASAPIELLLRTFRALRYTTISPPLKALQEEGLTEIGDLKATSF